MSDAAGNGKPTPALDPSMIFGGGRPAVHVLDVVNYSLANFRDNTAVLLLNQIIHSKNRSKRKDYSFVTFRCPHEIVENLIEADREPAPGEQRPTPYTLVLISVPPEALERMSSAVVLPGEKR